MADKILVDLYLFQENNKNQYLTNFERKDRKKLEFTFNMPVTDSFRIFSLIPTYENWYLSEENAGRDTFNLWITDPYVINLDTVILGLVFTGTDSIGKKVSMTDTVSFSFREPQKSKKKLDKEANKDSIMVVRTIKNRSTLDLNQVIAMNAETPIDKIDTSRIELYSKEDSLFIPERYHLERDSMNIRTVHLIKEWKPETTYRLNILPKAFTDIYGLTNDTIDVSFTSRDEGYYGVLHVDIKGVHCPLIVQLMDSKESVLRERVVRQDETVSFEYLKPSQYKIKFVHDCNDNGKWDTGDYMKAVQPEKVEYYNGEINVRSNWELEINKTVGGEKIFLGFFVHLIPHQGCSAENGDVLMLQCRRFKSDLISENREKKLFHVFFHRVKNKVSCICQSSK